ncbi:MAG: c-type cytochrome [Solirubrobacterales bacterium]
MRRKSLFKVIDPFLLVLGAICLLGLGVLIGVLIESDDSSQPPTLQADEIGNVKDGRALFVTQGCAMCHSFEGQGGSDAPPLDFMKGELTGGDIANMSGMIWNHVPMMKEAFAEEHIPFPEFSGNEMASLIAYLHAGGPPPDVKMSPEMMGGEKQNGGEPGDEESAGGSRQMGGEKMMP